MPQLSVAQCPDGRIVVYDGEETVTYLCSKSEALRWVEESLEVANAAIGCGVELYHDWEAEVEQLNDIGVVLIEGGLITLEESA